MFKIIKRYFYLIEKNHLNTLWIFILFLILPLIFSGIGFYFEDKAEIIISKGSGDIINFLVLMSGFLFMSITLIISNIQINENIINKISNKIIKKKEKVKKILFELKELLILDIVFQFFMITIDAILIIIYKGFPKGSILFLIFFFFFLSILGLVRLIRNFLLFQRNIEN